MEKITYGAPRLVDWVAQIKAGAATVRVHFTGGALTTYGVTPAEFTTSNPFVQKVIEGSPYFKEGRIMILRRTEIEEPVKPAPRQDRETPLTSASASAQIEREETGPESADETEAADAVEAVILNVGVTCLQDAQAYLQENFGISSHKVRSCEAAQKAAAEHGVRFTGGKFDTLDTGEKADAEASKE